MIPCKEENLPKEILFSLKSIHFLPCWEVFKARFAILRSNMQPHHRSDLCPDLVPCHSLPAPSFHFLSALSLSSLHLLFSAFLSCSISAYQSLSSSCQVNRRPTISSHYNLRMNLPHSLLASAHNFSFIPTDILAFPSKKLQPTIVQRLQVDVKRWNRNSQHTLLNESRL